MSFADLYNAHSRMVFNLALQYVQNRADAEEITQDVFVSVHQGLSKFRDEARLETWIYRIAVNRSLDFVKSRRRLKRFGFLTSLYSEETNELKYDPPMFDHPGVMMEDKEAVERVFGLINELPDNQRTALILHKIDDLTQVEVAEIMGISPKAVESLVQRAKTSLSRKLTHSSEG